MKYICKFKIEDGRYSVSPHFGINLYYKKEGSLFYKNYNMYFKHIHNCSDEDKVLEDLKNLNKLGVDELMGVVKNIISKEEGKEIEAQNKTKAMDDEMEQFKRLTKKFTIEI